MISAVVFVPSGSDQERWLAICASYCTQHKYEIIAVATTWDDVVTMMHQDEAQIAIVARRDHLPPDRPYRLEVVAEVQTAPQDSSQRRPKRRVSVKR